MTLPAVMLYMGTVEEASGKFKTKNLAEIAERKAKYLRTLDAGTEYAERILRGE